MSCMSVPTGCKDGLRNEHCGRWRTHEEEDLDGVRAAECDEVCGVVFVAGADDKDVCSVRVADVHRASWAVAAARRRTRTRTR